jgi:hypothetical protein
MATTRRTAPLLTLDDLAKLAPDELMELYRNAKTPRLADLDGKLDGRMLAAPRASKPQVRRWLAGFAKSGIFPWRGKTFEHETAEHGHGVNRLFGERVSWFHFETSVGPSRAGDFDSVHLDYSHDNNPALVRDVYDEVREVALGLWLGLAYLHLDDGYHLACYFAVARRADTAAASVKA